MNRAQDNFQYEMPPKIIDMLSANELLQVLNTLKTLRPTSATPVRINANTHSHAPKALNFQAYMEQKQQNPSKTPPQKVNSKDRQSISPNNAKPAQGADSLRSKTHSPAHQSQKNKKMAFKKSKVGGDNKENTINKTNHAYTASSQSKRILAQQEKRGNIYIPIQFRAGQLIKNRNIKIAQLQKEKESSRIAAEQQCTFRPAILKHRRKTAQGVVLRQIQEASLRFESGSENEFIEQPQRPLEGGYSG